MNYILFDNFRRNNLLPLTYTRPVSEIRIGILTIREKWENYLGKKTSTLTEDYLRKKFPVVKEENNILINASICPNEKLIKEIKALKSNEVLVAADEVIIAMHLESEELEKVEDGDTKGFKELEFKSDFLKINNVWDIFTLNRQAIIDDFELITKGRESCKPGNTCSLIGDGKLFIEKGAKIWQSTINTTNGPVYIGKNSEIMEGSHIRGPFAMCENSIVKMGAKIYGPTTLGPCVKVGGELNNCVFFGYSNKAHDGFLGHSVIGEWCNLGAGTNNSNLKNNYKEIRLYNYPQQSFIPTDLQFCGMIMGDHSKCAINTMFNTGTVVGVNSSIFGSGFPRNFIPSFSWGGHAGFSKFDINKAIDIAKLVYERRNLKFDEIEQDILRSVFDITYNNS